MQRGVSRAGKAPPFTRMEIGTDPKPVNRNASDQEFPINLGYTEIYSNTLARPSVGHTSILALEGGLSNHLG